MGNASSADTNDGMRLRLHSLVNQAPGLTPADVDKIYRCFRKYCVQGTCSVSNERTKNRRRIHHSLASELNSLSDTHTLTYLRRPFGRPNTIVNNDRGWLFLERITIAIKAAAADKAQFEQEFEFPYKQVQFMQSLLQGLPIEARESIYSQPGLFGQGATGASILMELLKNFPGGEDN